MKETLNLNGFSREIRLVRRSFLIFPRQNIKQAENELPYLTGNACQVAQGRSEKWLTNGCFIPPPPPKCSLRVQMAFGVRDYRRSLDTRAGSRINPDFRVWLWHPATVGRFNSVNKQKPRRIMSHTHVTWSTKVRAITLEERSHLALKSEVKREADEPEEKKTFRLRTGWSRSLK